MRHYILVIMLTFVTACSPTSVQIQQSLPLMSPTGSVSASELISVFDKTCLAHFPNNDSILTEFGKAGFSVTFEPRDDSEANFHRVLSQNSEILGSTGSTVLWWSGPDGGGAEAFQFCEVETELADPELINVELEKLLLSHGGNLEINDLGDVHLRKSGTYRNSLGTFRISFEQRKSTVYSPGSCGGLDSCQTWGEATLSIDTRAPQ